MTDKVREALELIVEQGQWLRQNGPAPEDLQSLSDAVEVCTDIAGEALAALANEPGVSEAQRVADTLRKWAMTYRCGPVEHRFPSDPDAEFFPVDLEYAASLLSRQQPAGEAIPPSVDSDGLRLAAQAGHDRVSSVRGISKSSTGEAGASEITEGSRLTTRHFGGHEAVIVRQIHESYFVVARLGGAAQNLDGGEGTDILPKDQVEQVTRFGPDHANPNAMRDDQ